MKRFNSEKEIFDVVDGFESATISRTDWRHAEHLTVALHYLSLHDFDTAYEKMRSGIFKLLGAFGVDLTVDMPYHETLTVFWMRIVAGHNASANGQSLLEKANSLIEKFDKDYPLRFYTREILFSDEARKRFIEPAAASPLGS